MRKHEELSLPRGMTRKEHQRLLDKRRRRRQKRRNARIRRLRLYKSLRSLQFWTRAAMLLVVGLCIAFWARFAFVYDIPSYVSEKLPQHVVAYVTVKPWWFGPPVFDIGHDAPKESYDLAAEDPYQRLLQKLGRYEAVVEHPQFIWVLRT